MNEREFRLWAAVAAAAVGRGDASYGEAAEAADRMVEQYRRRQREAMAKQYTPAPFV